MRLADIRQTSPGEIELLREAGHRFRPDEPVKLFAGDRTGDLGISVHCGFASQGGISLSSERERLSQFSELLARSTRGSPMFGKLVYRFRDWLSFKLYLQEVQSLSQDLSEAVRSLTPEEFKEGLKEGKQTRAEALRDDFYDLITIDSCVKYVLESHRAEQEDLEEIYWWLARVGLCQWINGWWGGTAPIALAPALDYLLTQKSDGRLEGSAEDRGREAMANLFQAMDKGWDTLPYGRVNRAVFRTDRGQDETHEKLKLRMKRRMEATPPYF